MLPVHHDRHRTSPRVRRPRQTGTTSFWCASSYSYLAVTGFGEPDVRGADYVVSSLGVLVGVTPDERPPEESRRTYRGADCDMRHIRVLATATKEREIEAPAVADCFG